MLGDLDGRSSWFEIGDGKRVGEPLLIAPKSGETELVVVVFHKGVLLRGKVGPADADQVSTAGEAGEFVEAKVLDATIENPATHQPGLDDERLPVEFSDENGDETVIDESIAQTDGQGDEFGGT
jgi:hypothetical protein